MVSPYAESPRTFQDFSIVAYYTISLAPISIEDKGKFSRSFMRKVERHVGAGEYATYLIGQLGRNNSTVKEELSGEVILKAAIDTIKKASNIVGGRLVLAECEDALGLVAFYEKYGFKEVNRRTGESGILVQFLKVV